MRGRWDFVLVDELQDLSLAQYEVVAATRLPAPELLRRGDDEQWIFSWTGADPAILERFRADYGRGAARSCSI